MITIFASILGLTISILAFTLDSVGIIEKYAECEAKNKEMIKHWKNLDELCTINVQGRSSNNDITYLDLNKASNRGDKLNETKKNIVNLFNQIATMNDSFIRYDDYNSNYLKLLNPIIWNRNKSTLNDIQFFSYRKKASNLNNGIFKHQKLNERGNFTLFCSACVLIHSFLIFVIIESLIMNPLNKRRQHT